MKKFLSFILMGSFILNVSLLDITSSKANGNREPVHYSSEVLGQITTFFRTKTETGIQKKANSLFSSYHPMDEQIGEILNRQMENYFQGTGTEKAEVLTMAQASEYLEEVGAGAFSEEEITYFQESGLYSVIRFPVINERYEYKISTGSEEILQYVYQAIGQYPNLASLYTQVFCLADEDAAGKYQLSELLFLSPIEKEQISEKTLQYKKYMADLEAVPKADKTMTAAEKLLYIHDSIIADGEYATSDKMNQAVNHTPLAISLNKEGVCQSYTAIMNQAARDLNMESLQICSDVHAWNAVKIRNQWYYLDLTYDDPVFSNPLDKPKNYVNHQYFLFTPQSGMADSPHRMNEVNEQLYGYILDNMGDEFEDYFPKANEIKTQMVYVDGKWNYSQNGTSMTWKDDGPLDPEPTPTPISTPTPTPPPTSTSTTVPTSTPGISQGMPEDGDSSARPGTSMPASPTPPGKENSKAPETMTNSSGNVGTTDKVGQKSLEVKTTRPGKTKIRSLKNKKSKTLECKLKKVRTVSGYQVHYATNRKFKKWKGKNSKSTTILLKKLKKKKRYYVKARTYKMVQGKKIYGKWCSVKKCFVKK